MADCLPEDIDIQRYSNPKVGRPTLEETQPGLLEALREIIQINLAGADDKRRSEVIRTVKTIDDLKNEATNLGFSLSRSGLYYQLLPRDASTIEGKRHHSLLKVRLLKSSNSERSSHPDKDFCFQNHKMIKDMIKLYGKESVTFLSVDDKCRVPLGLTAATKQAPLMMHVDYTVKLPDHDFVKAPSHKLIPSVNALCEINDGGVTYSGPTLIMIRSGKHDSSTAASHHADFDTLFKRHPTHLKPIVVVSVDGGPDENLRFPKTLAYSIKKFKENNLDVFITLCHAPGNSALNTVERRMAPLSRDLAGVVLPHEHYGSHLNSAGKTIDEVLERQNFQHAGETLAEIWSNTAIGGWPVEAEYVLPPSSLLVEEKPILDEKWIAAHVQQSQYCLMIVKCGVLSCCKDWHTNWPSVFPTRFLPAPKLVERTAKGPKIPSPQAELNKNATWLSLSQNLALKIPVPGAEQFPLLPFDYFCPSVVKKGCIGERVCGGCGKYFPSVAALKRHKAVHMVEEVEEEEIQELEQDTQDSSAADAPVFKNIFEIMMTRFVDDL